MKKTILLCSLLLSGICTIAQTKSQPKEFTQDLMQDSCIFTSTGRNTYFILEPGYQLVLAGKDGKDSSRLVITVLNETKKIGNVETRIIEENESVNGKTEEISRNYFAICKQTNTVYYFGEDVDNYKDGKVDNHSGAWVAEGKNKEGVEMPGLIMLGSRFYQEIAPGVAMDRAEILSTTETKNTPAGNFTHVLKTEETTPLEPDDKEYKLYAPGVGQIIEEKMVLVKYGFVK